MHNTIVANPDGSGDGMLAYKNVTSAQYPTKPSDMQERGRSQNTPPGCVIEADAYRLCIWKSLRFVEERQCRKVSDLYYSPAYVLIS